jgi:hypothetical protein
MSETPELTIRRMREGVQFIESPVYRVKKSIADLAAIPPTTLNEAVDRLIALRTELQAAMESLWAASADKQAVLAEVSVYVEADALLAVALGDLEKAQTGAAAALDRVFKKLHAPRVEQRVWNKLTPAASPTETAAIPSA